MIEAYPRALHRAAPIALIVIIGLIGGCERKAQQPPPPEPIDGSHVQISAWLRTTSPCQQGTIELLRDLEDAMPARVSARIIDISTAEGRERWQEHGLDAVAIEINGNITVTWGEGDSRRTVSFMHPPGFAWTHEDLRAAVEAALEGELRPADPAEAEGVRLMDVSVRGQSIRVGDEGAETGQLIVQDQIVLEISGPRDDLAPGQRVTAAADALKTVLEKPFTPNQLTLKRVDGDVAMMVGEERLLTATEADAEAKEMSPEGLAAQWRFALREALIAAALERPAAPEPEPQPVPESEPEPSDPSTENPEQPLTNPLQPTS